MTIQISTLTTIITIKISVITIILSIKINIIAVIISIIITILMITTQKYPYGEARNTDPHSAKYDSEIINNHIKCCH